MKDLVQFIIIVNIGIEMACIVLLYIWKIQDSEIPKYT